MKIAYIMSRFPNLTETFVLYEIVALERQGVATTVYPLLRTRQEVVHPEARRIAERAHYHPFISFRILAANASFAWRRPRAYFGVLREVLRGTWGSANFLVGAIGIFPKAVQFAREMVREGVTHVHAHFSNHPAVAALIIHRLTGIPFSFTGHGHDIHVERRMLGEKIAAAKFAVVISAYNKKLILQDCRGFDPEKLHVIHCGVDTDLFAPRVRPRAEGEPSMVCIGSFIEVKGHTYLVEACRILRDRGVPFRCHLVGRGPGRKRIEAQIAEAGLGREITLHGPLPRPEVIELLREADLIVQPSVPTARGAREGIPVSLMEGMACGLPVAASAISGIPELVEDGVNGLLAPPRDPAALADALERLIRDADLRDRLGRAGREKVRREFDLARNAARLLDLVRRPAPPQAVGDPACAEIGGRS